MRIFELCIFDSSLAGLSEVMAPAESPKLYSYPETCSSSPASPSFHVVSAPSPGQLAGPGPWSPGHVKGPEQLRDAKPPFNP